MRWRMCTTVIIRIISFSEIQHLQSITNETPQNSYGMQVESASATEFQAEGSGQMLAGHQDMRSTGAWAYSVGLGQSSATLECRGRALVRGSGGRTLSVLGSRVWPFGVMWRHRSRDHFFTPYAISYWWSFGTKPLSNGFRDIQHGM